MGFAASVFLPDSNATDRLGRAIAAAVLPGDILLLEGQIGAGKTHFARALIKTLFEMADLPSVEVPSPTYTLVQTYELPHVNLWHADLYRLGDFSEVAELGLDDAMGNDIVVIEWPDRLESTPNEALTITFSVEDGGRRASLSSESNRWQVLEAVDEVLNA